MSIHKTPKSKSYEYLPLLLSNEHANSSLHNNYVTKSNAFSNGKIELEISLETSLYKAAEIEIHDFAELSNCQAIIHIIKASIGTGVLALPSAIRYSGLLFGSIAILILSTISIYSSRLLLRVVAHLRLTSPTTITDLDYEKTVLLCFQLSNEKFRPYAWLHHVIVIALSVGQIGNLASYQIFVAENTKSLVEFYVKEEQYIFPIWTYQLFFAILLAPLLFIKTLDKLSYFTQIANILMVTSLIISLVYCLQDPLPIKDLPLIKLNNATPLFFGIVVFSFESINLINPIENHLKNKKDMLNFCGVLNIATSIVLVTYLVIGICGYWKFGDNISSSLILSIPMTPWYNMLCKPFYILSILVSFALQAYVMFCIVWKKLASKFKSERSRQIGGIIIRISLVALSTILSISIPHFDLFISLVGAMTGAFISLIFPSICNSVIILSNSTFKYRKLQISINTIILCVGIFGCIIGTYSSIINIIKALKY